MLHRIIASVALCGVLAVAANHGAAATVNLELVYHSPTVGCDGCTLSGPGTYQLYARMSLGDNNGIASYGISVQNVSTLLHRAPRVISSTNGDDEGGSAGFSVFRSANNTTATGTGFYFGASQDTVAPTPFLIDGFGQTAGSFAAELPAGNTNIGTTQPTWSGKLLLAEGTFSGTSPDIDLTNIDVFVNLFSPGGTNSVFQAQTLTKSLCCFGDPFAIVGDLHLTSNYLAEVVAGNVPVSNVDTLAFNNVSAPIYTPLIFPPKPLVLNHLPTLSDAGAFSWNISGALPGWYEWGVTGTNSYGFTDGGTVTVFINTPEPGTLGLFSLAIAGLGGIARRRS